MQLTKRREEKAKFDLSNRTDKTEVAQKEITEWETKVQRCQQGNRLNLTSHQIIAFFPFLYVIFVFNKL
jgi:Flp pilus assembly protein TadB